MKNLSADAFAKDLKSKASKFSTEIVETVRMRLAIHRAHPGKLVRFKKAGFHEPLSNFVIGAVWSAGESPSPRVWTMDTVNDWKASVSDEEVYKELNRRLGTWMAGDE
jgi:hypothetical protein